MELEKFREKAEDILKKGEDMKFKEFCEDLLDYSFQKGFEIQKNKIKSRNVDEKEISEYDITRETQKQFAYGYRSYIGDFYLSDRVEFVEKRADEFGLELDNEYQIKDFKTAELEKEFKKLKEHDYDDYYGEFFNAYDFNCSATIFNMASDYYNKIEKEIKEMPHNAERNFFVLIEDVEKMIDEKHSKENPYFKEKENFIKELTSDFMDDRIEKIKKGEIPLEETKDYYDAEGLKKEAKKLGFHEKTLKVYSYKVIDDYFEEKEIYNAEKYKKEIHNIYNKEREKEQNKEKE